nr:AraC family transcriptional regulator [Faecalibaculum rodentium]
MRYSCSDKDRSLPLFIDSIGYDWPQENVSRPDGYRYAHWLSTESGSGIVTIGPDTITLGPGQGILILPGIPHSYRAVGDGWTTAYFTFGGSLLMEVLQFLNIREYIYVDDSSLPINPFILEVMQGLDEQRPYSMEIASGQIYNFLMLLRVYIRKTRDDRDSAKQVIQPVAQYLEENYMKEIGASDLTEILCYSSQYITRLFKRVYSMTPTQYLQQLRIRKAKELLVSRPELSVSEICELTGFNDVSYFITQFRKSEKMTPKAFRRLYYS